MAFRELGLGAGGRRLRRHAHVRPRRPRRPRRQEDQPRVCGTAHLRRAVRVLVDRAADVGDRGDLALAEAQQDVAGAFVRVRWTVADEDRHEVDRAAIERLLAGAMETKLEGRIVPVVRTRAAGISQLANLADKVRVWAQVTEARADLLLACLQALSSQAPEAIVEGVLRRQAGPACAAGVETPVTRSSQPDLAPALSS